MNGNQADGALALQGSKPLNDATGRQAKAPGADFAKLARENTDDPSGKENGGQLPPFSRGQMVPEFEAQAFAMEPGEIRGPIKTQFGYHIIKFVSKTPSRTRSLAEARPQLAAEVSERLATADRTLVPNRFVVHLNPDDLEGFGEMTASLASELADGALVFARARHYTLVDRPRVTLFADPSVERADIRVTARFADPIAGGQGNASPMETGTDSSPSLAVHGDTMVFTVPRPTAPASAISTTMQSRAVKRWPVIWKGACMGHCSRRTETCR